MARHCQDRDSLSKQVRFSREVTNLKQLATYVLHVLLISIDGMHSLDFLNCSQGLLSINGGESYCPNLAQLAQSGAVYTSALTPRRGQIRRGF
jgi:hypothetical protein